MANEYQVSTTGVQRHRYGAPGQQVAEAIQLSLFVTRT